MSNPLRIAALLDRPDILKSLVEQLATRKTHAWYENVDIPFGQKALETSSEQVYITGAVFMQNAEETFHIPFITGFMFTCIKEAEGNYEMAWGSSLS